VNGSPAVAGREVADRDEAGRDGAGRDGAGRAAAITCWEAGPHEMASHYAIRHQVFVQEQGVLVFTDIDDHDASADAIHVVGARHGDIGGTVRLYPLDGSGLWKGDRLAVLPGFRASMLGAYLVRFAVARAAAAGGTVMEATVQLPNVRFFERLGWRTSGQPMVYLGLPHQLMIIATDR
jgi:putative N-acetyltransferase (TIGR04045 family)